jgi:CheY-like chemotaxis protein
MKKLVFIVEDNLVQQKMLQVHFEEILGDYTVRTFDHPDAMMSALKEKPFAMVLDHFFNDKEGKTGLDYLKLLRERYKTIPVIYYTTLDDEHVRSQVLALGAEQYIIKNSASLVYLKTALDALHTRIQNNTLFRRLFYN